MSDGSKPIWDALLTLSKYFLALETFKWTPGAQITEFVFSMGNETIPFIDCLKSHGPSKISDLIGRPAKLGLSTAKASRFDYFVSTWYAFFDRRRSFCVQNRPTKMLTWQILTSGPGFKSHLAVHDHLWHDWLCARQSLALWAPGMLNTMP
jgi:hypothetical protein